MKHGLTEETAYKCVTIRAAKALDLADELGSIEPGKAADVVIWESEPFKAGGRPRTVPSMVRSSTRRKIKEVAAMLIKNCMLIDGADIFEKMKDIRIVNGKIKEVADCLMPEGDEEIIDGAEGALVTPGIVEPSCQVGVNSQIHRFEENDADEEGPIVQSCGPTTP